MATSLDISSLESSERFHVYATIADTDLRDGSHGPANEPCKMIEFHGPGTLVITKMSGTNETLPSAPSGHKFFVRATDLVASGSTATGVIVHW